MADDYREICKSLHGGPLTPDDVARCEAFACGGDSVEKQVIAKLVALVYSLQHELRDPNYLYAGGRVHRQAIIYREALIDRLRERVRELAAGG